MIAIASILAAAHLVVFKREARTTYEFATKALPAGLVKPRPRSIYAK
jgi:hypothetical protein